MQATVERQSLSQQLQTEGDTTKAIIYPPVIHICRGS